MTTIIAKKNEKTGAVDLGWDSRVTPGNGFVGKVTEVNNQFFFGVSGYLRFLDILQYTDVSPVHHREFQEPTFDARGYLITRVIPEWIEALRVSFKDVPDQKDDWLGGSILIVIAGRIFSIGSEFSVVEYNDYAGIGSGSDFALGALAAGKSVEQALKIAAELDPYTGGDLTVAKGLK